MSLRQTYVKSRVGHALQGRAALGRRRVDESMPMRLKQVRIGRPALIVGAAVPRSATCSRAIRHEERVVRRESAFRAAPRAVVGLKGGVGGWCILASAMPRASSRVGSRVAGASRPRTQGGSVAGTLPPLNLLKFQLAPLLGPTRVPPSTLRTPSRPGRAASRPPYLPEREGQVRGGGRPPGPAERPTRPLLAPTRSRPCGE